jgi:hypothetical protein
MIIILLWRPQGLFVRKGRDERRPPPEAPHLGSEARRPPYERQSSERSRRRHPRAQRAGELAHRRELSPGTRWRWWEIAVSSGWWRRSSFADRGLLAREVVAGDVRDVARPGARLRRHRPLGHAAFGVGAYGSST